FDFLEAPARFTRLLDSRAARWVFSPSLSAGRLAIKVASRAARFVLRELERFAGGRMLATIGDFFAAASEGVDQIVDRLRKTEALMRSQVARFVLVTTAEADRLEGARALMREMKAGGFALSGVIVNRFLDERSWQEAAAGAAGHLDTIPRLAETLAVDPDGASGVAEVVRFLVQYREQTLNDIERVLRFARELPEGVRLALAPEINIGVRDLAAVARVGKFLTESSGSLRLLESLVRRFRPDPSSGRAVVSS
ncbi:MAG TPA: hypothetical protein VEJ86_09865, partial [Candidatus Binataceae bacterium]|nr:hypothetical protein [Candidatus Binataceae bacterium]